MPEARCICIKIILCVEIITVLPTVSATRSTSHHFDRPVFDCNYSSVELYAHNQFGGASVKVILVTYTLFPGV